MFFYTHVSTHLENVTLILLKKKKHSKNFKPHQKSGKKKKVKRVKGLTCRKCTVI